MSNSNAIASPNQPVVFEEFFELGLEETVSPFLVPSSRYLSANLTLKAASVAAGLLIVAFVLQFYPSLLPVSNLLLIFVYFLAGIPALIESIEELMTFDVNIDILMTLAAFSSLLIGSGMEGALLLVLFALSGAMEDAVTSKAKSSLSSLHKLSPTKACVIDTDGSIREKAIKDISPGMEILVKAGEIVPLDGIVIAGSSSVNLVHLTGENLPATKVVGDSVPAGGNNLDGVLTLKVTSTSAESSLARIIKLVTQAQEARPKLQRWFDSLSQRYAMTIIGLSFFFAAVMPLVLSIPYLGLEGSIYRALAFLIAASPCALIIAIPIAYLSALSACARHGILLKGGISLDALASCKAIAFDKTGTLTLGELTYVDLEPVIVESKLSHDNLPLAVAYALEKNAVHPIAKAISHHAEELKDLPLITLVDFKSIPGHGLEAIAQLPEGDIPVYIGNPTFIVTKISAEKADILIEAALVSQQRGHIVTAIAIASNVYLFSFQDCLRPKIAETIAAIKKRGWHTIMLTGDHHDNARKIALEANINEYYAELKPEDKLEHITQLSQLQKLAMIGDGVNDAPALARATVGISMGKVGSDSAIEAADIVLLHDNIEWLDWLIEKAYQTQRIVKQNVILASAAILFASIPALGGYVPLWLAVILHEGGTILVGLNALRLLR
ncbi:MAG: cation-translocating P-type ATPase [Parachlamydiaceae bacterium]|nr:cation-translocating P-type ATPase [Parachlamydiaceae bacterium]